MVIILTGTDTYQSLQRLIQLRDAFKKKHDPTGLNTITLDGETTALPAMRDAFVGGGLFSNRRMVIIDPYNPKKAGVKVAALTEALEHLVDGDKSIVIIREVIPVPTDYRKKSAAVASLKIAKSKVEVFPMLTPVEAEKWLVKEAKARGGSFTAVAARHLVGETGSDTWRLSMELDKLLTFCDGRPISIDDVEKLTTTRIESDVFAFIDAVGQRQKNVAWRLLHQELEAGTNALALVSALTRHVENLLGTLALQPAAPAVVARELGIHPYVATKAISQIKKFSRAELIRWHAELFEIDRKLKSTPLDAETLMMLFVGR